MIEIHNRAGRWSCYIDQKCKSFNSLDEIEVYLNCQLDAFKREIETALSMSRGLMYLIKDKNCDKCKHDSAKSSDTCRSCINYNNFENNE